MVLIKDEVAKLLSEANALLLPLRDFGKLYLENILKAI
jgi:hypothetical protein